MMDSGACAVREPEIPAAMGRIQKQVQEIDNVCNQLEKKLVLNATNCKTLEQLSGSPDVDQWRNLAITLYGTTTNFGGQTVECLRIRPTAPTKTTSADPEPTSAEPTSDDSGGSNA